MLRLFAKPKGCVQCDAVKRWLTADHRGLVEGIDYEIIDVTTPGADLALLQEHGYQQVPVVFLGSENHFYGFDSIQLQQWYETRN